MNPLTEIRLAVPLAPVDRLNLAAQQLAAPVGHLILGPARYAPFWACATCGVRWTDGPHPGGVGSTLTERGADLPTPYWDR